MDLALEAPEVVLPPPWTADRQAGEVDLPRLVVEEGVGGVLVGADLTVALLLDSPEEGHHGLHQGEGPIDLEVEASAGREVDRLLEEV